tara:strand:+ start:1326 stop:1745 length:420 start_codon:yes stop_codon:yes gene_type:complete
MLLYSCLSSGSDELDSAFKRRSIMISSSNQSCNHFVVWLAETRNQQTRGLMYVKSLPKNTGMLFIYPNSNIRAMWMKNTFISLDMIFIDENGIVSSIEKNTEPQSLKTIRSEKPIKYVLELAGGKTDQIKLIEGDHIYW